MLDRALLAQKYHLREPTTRMVLCRHEQEAGYAFPEEYGAFLLLSNGLTTNGNLVLLEVGEIRQRNRDYEVQDYLPGYVMIGDDSGGTAIVMRIGERAVYEVGMGVMDEAFMVKSAESLEDLLVGHDGKTLSERDGE